MKKYTVREGSIAWFTVILAKTAVFLMMMAGVPLIMMALS